jgi:hypothetical protein
MSFGRLCGLAKLVVWWTVTAELPSGLQASPLRFHDASGEPLYVLLFDPDFLDGKIDISRFTAESSPSLYATLEAMDQRLGPNVQDEFNAHKAFWRVQLRLPWEDEKFHRANALPSSDKVTPPRILPPASVRSWFAGFESHAKVVDVFIVEVENSWAPTFFPYWERLLDFRHKLKDSKANPCNDW